MAKRTGRDHKLFYTLTPMSAADYSTATWIEITKISNVDADMSREEIDADDRSNNGFKSKLSGLADYKIDGTLNYDPADAAFVALQTAWSTGAELAVMRLDSAQVSGAKGEASNVVITNFKVSEPIGGAVTVAVTFSATQYTHTVAVA